MKSHAWKIVIAENYDKQLKFDKADAFKNIVGGIIIVVGQSLKDFKQDPVL